MTTNETTEPQETPMSQVNVPLLRKTLEHITEHPREWNQREWATRNECGTAYCLAGHVALIEGQDVDWDAAWGFGGQANASLTTTGVPIRECARDALGLTDDQAEGLFWQTNTLRTLYEYAHQFTDGEITAPETLPDGS